MYSLAPLSLWQLAIRHYLLTTAVGGVFSFLYFGFVAYLLSRHTSPQYLGHEEWQWAGITTLVGGVLGLLGIWWVRLLLGWTAASAHPRLLMSLWLVLTYLPLIVYGAAFGYFGFVTPIWCVASLLVLRLLPPQQQE